jgi:antitoxin YefM
MITTNISEFKNNVVHFLDTVNKTNESLIVSRDDNKNSIILPLSEYNSIMETLYLLSDEENAKQIRESIAQAKKGVFVNYNTIIS